jgi:cytochrome b6-f complex iron-sulfur subunit
VDPQPPTRRDFIGKACIASACVTCAYASAPAVNYLVPRAKPKLQGLIRVARSDEVADGKGVQFQVDDETQVLVVRVDGSLTALNPSCTHLGCFVKWNERDKIIRCPCHSATFHRDGSKPTTPAERPLPAFPVREEGGQIYVTF